MKPSQTPWMQRHQIFLYLAGILAGAALAVVTPQAAPFLGAIVYPLLFCLLFVTFMGVSASSWRRAIKDVRFLLTVMITNFVVLPPVIWLLTRFIVDQPGLLIGATVVLLAPCVDYVVVFTGVAGGDAARVGASTPLLMLMQILLLPLWMQWIVGHDALAGMRLAPVLWTVVLMVLVPLVLAGVIKFVTRSSPVGALVQQGSDAAMVPLMIATLACVVASQLPSVGNKVSALWPLALLYALFAVLATGLGWMGSKLIKLSPAAGTALTFVTVTRNSLVVLPVAIALSQTNLPQASAEGLTDLSLAPLAVVTQTLVELIVMIILIVVAPKIFPARQADPPGL